MPAMRAKDHPSGMTGGTRPFRCSAPRRFTRILCGSPRRRQPTGAQRDEQDATDEQEAEDARHPDVPAEARGLLVGQSRVAGHPHADPVLRVRARAAARIATIGVRRPRCTRYDKFAMLPSRSSSPTTGCMRTR